MNLYSFEEFNKNKMVAEQATKYKTYNSPDGTEWSNNYAENAKIVKDSDFSETELEKYRKFHEDKVENECPRQYYTYHKRMADLYGKLMNGNSVKESELTTAQFPAKDEKRGTGTVSITFDPDKRAYSYVANFEHGQGEFSKPNTLSATWSGSSDLFGNRSTDIKNKFTSLNE